MSQPRRGPSKRFRGIGLAVATLVLMAAGWSVWQRGKVAGDEGAYRTETVQRGDIRVAISATGTLSAISTVIVGSQISGLVTDVLVDFNSPVKKGQVLATIDPSTYQAQIDQGSAQVASAQAQLRQAQASLRNATIDYQRKANLGRQQLVAQSDIDFARSALDQAQAQVNSAQAQIRQQTASTQTTRVNLQRTLIRSPVDGVVLTRTIEPGQTVAASLSAPELFKIAEDLSKMKIELAVDESDIGQVKVGQTVGFSVDAFPERKFSGVVEQVRLSATSVSNVVTFPVVVVVDNGDGTLLPGLTVNAEIEVSKLADVLTLGNAALRFKPAEGSALLALQSEGQGQGAGRGAGRGAGMAEDLQALAASLALRPNQQAAFDAALEQMRQNQAARSAQGPGGAAGRQGGGNRLFGGGGGPRSGGGQGGGDASMQAQMRARMRDRFNQQFGDFRASLDDQQRARWDASLESQLNAKRVTVHKLVDGTPELATLRLGASDGTRTQVSGRTIKEGDLVISGERSTTESK